MYMLMIYYKPVERPDPRPNKDLGMHFEFSSYPEYHYFGLPVVYNFYLFYRFDF